MGLLNNPAAWELMFREIEPMVLTDTFVCFSDEDHVDDEMPMLAWEWDL